MGEDLGEAFDRVLKQAADEVADAVDRRLWTPDQLEKVRAPEGEVKLSDLVGPRPSDHPPVPFERREIAHVEGIAGYIAVVYQEPDDPIRRRKMWYQHDTGKPGYLSFKIVEQVGLNSIDDDAGPYYDAWEDGVNVGTDDIELAEIKAEGDVKWDGCVNWKMREDVMAHHCGLEDDLDLFLAAIRSAVACCYEAIVDEAMR
jgi:hypothetical protein